MRAPNKPALGFIALVALSCSLLAVLGCRPPGELGDEYVYSDMGAIVDTKAKIPLLQPYESQNGYLLYVLPTRNAGHGLKGDPFEYRQLIALDTLCSGNSVCIWDPDKQLNVRCSQITGILGDPRVRGPVRDYLKSNCLQG